MDWFQLISTLLGMTAIMGSMFKFMWNRIDKRFEGFKNEMDKSFNEIKGDIKEIRLEIRETNQKISNIDSRLNRLEGQEEERFRNKIELYVSKNQKKEK